MSCRLGESPRKEAKGKAFFVRARLRWLLAQWTGRLWEAGLDSREEKAAHVQEIEQLLVLCTKGLTCLEKAPRLYPGADMDHSGVSPLNGEGSGLV